VERRPCESSRCTSGPLACQRPALGRYLLITCAHLPLATPQNVYFARRTLLLEWKLPHNPFHLIGCLLEVWVTCDQNHRSVSKEECDRLTWWTGALGRVVLLNNSGAPSTDELKPSCGHVGWTPRPSRYELAAPLYCCGDFW
jgi:hypothetical protein